MSNELQYTDDQAITPTTNAPTGDHPAAPAAADLASLRSGVGRAGVRSDLAKIAAAMGADDWRMVDWRTLNAANVAAILAKIEGAPATRNRARATLRGVARAAWRMGAIDSETLARINDLPRDRGSRELTGRQVEAWEIAALMRTCANDSTPAGARDAALFAVAIKTGARREELTAIALADVTLTDNANGGGAEIRVIGKGSKERTLYIDNGAMQALADWLAVRGDAPGALFCAISQTGIISPEHYISTTAAHKVLGKRAAQAGLSSLTWHDFRRSFAGALLDAGEDIATVAALMGHASVTTTARYDRRPAEARRRAARKISVPYFGRK